MKILFYPDDPIWQSKHGHSLSKTAIYCQKLGFILTNNIKDNWDIIIHWDYRDKNEVTKKLIESGKLIINRYCIDITKTKVEQVFKSIFLYSSFFELEKGYCIEKGEKQSAHNGRIIEFPKERKNNYIYQKIIDTRINKITIKDIILPIFFGEFPYGWFNYRSIQNSFGASNILGYYELFDTYKYFTKIEIEKIRQFCKIIGLDTGEINIIRSVYDNKIYIIDVNNLPGSRMFKKIPNPEININKLTKIFKLTLYKFIKLNIKRNENCIKS